MIKVRDLIKQLRKVDGEAFITMLVPYATAPIYVEEINAKPHEVILSGYVSHNNTLEDMVLHFGEDHRTIITSTMEFIIKMEKEHDLHFNYLAYLRDLISRTAKYKIDHPQIEKRDHD